MKLLAEENYLVGKWIYKDGSFVKDETTNRVEWLIANHLRKIATDKTGWDILFMNPEDNKFWELAYPQSEMHGGGPPSLINISEEEARHKYSI